MKSTRSLIPHWEIGQGLLIACLLAIFGGSAGAQDAAKYCESSGQVKEALQKLPKFNEEEGNYKRFQEQRLAALRELAQRHPDDLHVQKRYADMRRYDDQTDRAALREEYRVRAEKNPQDVAANLLYARLLVGNNTKEAIAQLEKLAQQAPDFPATYLELGAIYNYPAFRDLAKARAHLKKWAALCPTAFDNMLNLSRSGDQELMRDALRRLRARLANPTAPEDVSNYDDAWSLEFKLKPVPEHAQLRQQIAEEVKQLRAKNLGTKEWLQALQAGYRMADDKEGKRWAEDEMSRLFPKSNATVRMARQRWDAEHPRPKPNDPAEKRQTYNEALVKATDEWLKQWPDAFDVWNTRFFALEQLEQSANSDVEAAGEGLLRAMAKNEGYFYMIPPAEVIIARTYLKRNLSTERVLALAQKGLADFEQREKRNEPSDLYLREEGDDGNSKYVRWYAWPILAEAHAKLKQPDKARAVLAAMSEALKKEKPSEKAKQSLKTGHQRNQASYWQTVAKVAEAENRKLDALTGYQTALSFRPPQPKPIGEQKDELADHARRLWKELGGTDEGWQAHLARNETKSSAEVAAASGWDESKQPLPEFALTDLQGKKWQLSDLKGKVAFVNFWATWCGPCVQELPYVQKLHEQMKDRKDVLILTMNIDDELGLVEPFMKENKYNFAVLPAQEYAQGQNVYSIPRNWVIGADGVRQYESLGFGGDGEAWMKKATEVIEKVRVAAAKQPN